MKLLRLLISALATVVIINCGGGGGGSGGGGEQPDDDITEISSGQVIFNQQVSNHQVFMAADGNGVAIWTSENGDGNKSIWSSTYTATSDSWSTAAEIANYERDIDFYEAAASDNGDVHVIWVQSNSDIAFNLLDVIKDQIWGNHYQPGSGWAGTDKIVDLDYETQKVKALGEPKVAINNNDHALLVWKQVEKVGVNISDYVKSLHSMSFNISTGWASPSPIEGNVQENSENFYELSMNDSGDAVVAWSEVPPISSTRKYISSAFYSPATGWSMYDLIETDPNDNINNFNTLKLQLLQNGNVVALWSYLTASASADISYARQYTASSMTWADAYKIEPNITNTNRAFDLDFNREGEGFYLFTERTDRVFPLRARFFTFDSRFNPAQTPTDSTGPITFLDATIDIDDSANAIALWAYTRPDGDGFGLRARRYGPLSGWTDIINFGRFLEDVQFSLDIIPDGSGDSAMALHIESERPALGYELIATKIDYTEE